MYLLWHFLERRNVHCLDSILVRGMFVCDPSYLTIIAKPIAILPGQLDRILSRKWLGVPKVNTFNIEGIEFCAFRYHRCQDSHTATRGTTLEQFSKCIFLDRRLNSSARGKAIITHYITMSECSAFHIRKAKIISLSDRSGDRMIGGTYEGMLPAPNAYTPLFERRRMKRNKKMENIG